MTDDLGIPLPLPEDEAALLHRPTMKMPPREWAKRNLFNSRFNTVLTLVMLAFAAFLAIGIARWLFAAAEWEAVQRNLTLFLQGTFPRDEQWRLVASVILVALSISIAVGNFSRATQDFAEITGEPYERTSVRAVIQRFWPGLLLVLVLLVMARTTKPWLLVGGVLVASLLTYFVARLRPRILNGPLWGATALTLLASFQIVSGTGGRAYLFAGVIIAITAWPFTEGLSGGAGLRRLVGSLARLGVMIAIIATVYGIYQLDFMDFGGIGWSDWSGLHLTLVASVITTVAAFPIGVLMALGRRSTFPAFRWLTITYIEFIRGVPLITLLLTAQFFIGFFLNSDDPLDDVTRALIAMILFTGAYIAEIIRGGLQAVPSGQIEAGQAMGLSPLAVMRLIVLPQALRAVIPAMVGQFIALFKDTSLLTIIGITELLGVRFLVHGQPEFRTSSFEVTLVFIAFVFWAIAFTMSRESQRLETKLGVGTR